MKGRTPTAEERHWLNTISDMGCIVCRYHRGVYSPAEVHHLDGKTKPGAHMQSIPLCPAHHRGGVKGVVSRADSRRVFERAYGTEAGFLEIVRQLCAT